MNLKKLTKIIGLGFLLSIFICSSIAIADDTAVTDDDDILDMIMPILAALPQKQAIPLNKAEAVSFPYGVTDDLFKPLPVMCPDRTAAKNNDIKNCTGITARQIELHKLIADFYSNAPACGMGGKTYPGIQEPNFDGSITAKDSSVMEKIQNNNDMKKSFDACSYRDMSAFNGLICISDTLMYGLKPDQSIGCKAIKDSQSVDGRMWRSPFRKAINNFGSLSDSFSDDMNLGVLLYSIATRDKTLLQSWMNWIDTNTPCLQEITKPVCTHYSNVCIKTDGKISLKYPLGKCTEYFCDTVKNVKSCFIRNLPRYCDGENCTLLPIYLKSIQEVSKYLGLSLPNKLTSASYNTSILPVVFVPIIGIPLTVAAMANDASWWTMTDSVLSKPGFSLHLDGMRVFLLRLMNPNQTQTDNLNRAASKLSERQPFNPFFSYLADGGPKKSASQITIDLFNKQCPSSHITDKYHHNEWAWQLADTDDNNNPIEAWKSGSLWDCRFMAQLLYSNPVK